VAPPIAADLFISANYIGIGMWKMGVIFFFAIPWLAMKIVGNERVEQKASI
jgi:hypothetical protein